MNMIKKIKIISIFLFLILILIFFNNKIHLREKFLIKNYENKNDDIYFFIEDDKLYVSAYDNITFLNEYEYINNGLAEKRNPEIICYDELKNLYYYDSYYNKQNEDIIFDIFRIRINENGDVKKVLKNKLVIDSEDLFVTDYMRYIGDIGKISLYITKDFRIYGIKNKKTILVDDLGDDGYYYVINNNISKRIAINSYEKKLYLLKPDQMYSCDLLYEVNEKLEKKLIAEDVKTFIVLQNEILYVKDALYRYKNGKTEKIMDAYDANFYGRHNDKKCYLNILKDKPFYEKFYLDEKNSNEEEKRLFKKIEFENFIEKTLYSYSDGEINKISDSKNVYISDYYSNEIYSIMSMNNKYLLFEKDYTGEKINFHDFYINLNDDEKKDDLKFRIKANNAYSKYNNNVLILDGYNIYRVKADEDAISSSINNIKFGNGYINYECNYETFEIFYGENVDKNNQKEKTVSNNNELQVVNMTCYLYE